MARLKLFPLPKITKLFHFCIFQNKKRRAITLSSAYGSVRYTMSRSLPITFSPSPTRSPMVWRPGTGARRAGEGRGGGKAGGRRRKAGRGYGESWEGLCVEGERGCVCSGTTARRGAEPRLPAHKPQPKHRAVGLTPRARVGVVPVVRRPSALGLGVERLRGRERRGIVGEGGGGGWC